MASAITISTSPSPFATSMATSVLPEAVGPTRARCRVSPGVSADGKRDAPPDSSRSRRHGEQVAFEVVRPGPVNSHLGERTLVQLRVACPEVNELVLTGSPRCDVGIPLAGAFDENLFSATDACRVARQPGSVDNDLQTLEALGDDSRIDEELRTQRGLSAFPRGVDERVRAVVRGFGRDFQGGSEVVLGFAG